MICVDTPLGGSNRAITNGRLNNGNREKSNNGKNLDLNNSFNGAADLGRIISSVSTHARWMLEKSTRGLNSYHLVVIRSTVPPGTTKRIVLPILERVSGLNAGRDFGLCMQPEFLRSATATDDFLHPRIIVIGEYDKHSGDLLHRIYSRFGGKKIRVDLYMAEFMKYVHNCFNATKISFGNEMWLVGRKLGIDSNYALQLAAQSAEEFWNPSYGLKGGRSYDGHCLPKDTQGFLRFAQDNDIDMPVLSAVVNLNTSMDRVLESQVVRNACSSLNKKKQKQVRIHQSVQGNIPPTFQS